MERVERAVRMPRRGEVWWIHLPTDPPDKSPRPVIVVSPDARNQHPRATTVLVIPLSSSIHRPGPSHVLLRMGETGLPADSLAQPDSISVVFRSELRQPNPAQRVLSCHRICQLAKLVESAMGCV